MFHVEHYENSAGRSNRATRSLKLQGHELRRLLAYIRQRVGVPAGQPLHIAGLKVSRHRALAFDVAAHFEIADRETRTWMAGFIRPLEAQINAYQEQSNTRIEGMGRIQDAEGDLIARVEELRRLAADVEAQREQWDAHHKRVMALLEVERAPSLA